MQTIISIFREVRDPRDINARHDLAAMLFIALAATLCGAKSCVDIADFAETLAEPERDEPLARDIDRALGGLAPVQRNVVASISVEGATIGETANALGMTESAVRVALHRGLKAIARRFVQD